MCIVTSLYTSNQQGDVNCTGCDGARLHSLTYVGWGCVHGCVLVELPGSHGVHLDEGDAATAPLPLSLVDREEGVEEEVDDALRDGLGVDGQTGQEVIHVAHVPELDMGKDGDEEAAVSSTTGIGLLWETLGY